MAGVFKLQNDLLKKTLPILRDPKLYQKLMKVLKDLITSKKENKSFFDSPILFLEKEGVLPFSSIEFPDGTSYPIIEDKTFSSTIKKARELFEKGEIKVESILTFIANITRVMTITAQEDRNIDFTVLPERDRTVLPERDRTVLPERDRTILPERDRTVLPERDRTVLPERDRTVLPERDRTVLPERDRTVLPERDRTVLPERDRTVLPERDRTVLPERDRTVLPERDRTVLPERDRTVLPERDRTVLPERDRTVLPERDRTVLPERDRTIQQERIVIRDTRAQALIERAICLEGVNRLVIDEIFIGPLVNPEIFEKIRQQLNTLEIQERDLWK